MTTPLPKQDERSAPKFDPKNEALLPNFFEEFERTVKAAGIDDDAEKMKKAVMGYLPDVKTLLFWQTMENYSDPLGSWEDFKKEVLDYYPGALARAEVTTEELLKVVETYQRKGVSSVSILNEFHREFTVVAKALMDQGTLPDQQVAKHYVAVLPDHIRAEINSALRTYFPNRKPGKAYTLNQLRQGVTNLLSDTSAPVDMVNFRVGDLAKVPGPYTDRPSEVKAEPRDESAAPWLQQIAALTQVVNDLRNEVLGTKPSAAKDNKSSRTSKACPWDGCPVKSMKECPDLADWVAKGRLVQNERGYVKLRDGGSLPNLEKYQKGLMKECFERYFEDNPTARTWLLESPATPASPPLPERAGIDSSTHSAYTLHGYQGPSMLTTAAAYALQSESDPSEAAVVRDLIFKMETRRTVKERSEATSSSTSTQSKSKVSATDGGSKPSNPTIDPDPSIPIPQRIVSSTRQPKLVIGKLPEVYVPPQERNLGAPPKEDSRNYKYRAPIETEAAVERVLESGMQSLVSIRQDDLLAIAPEYRRKIKDAVTSRRIGVDGNFLEDTGLLEGIFMCEAEAPQIQTIPWSAYFNDHGQAEEGDEYFVAKETLSIRGVNAVIGERAAHCILDSGCSLVVASLAACNAFGFLFDTGRRIILQSANGHTNWSIGLAKDVPFRFGEVLAFLQVQIVDTPAYDFLLGRPFEVLMQASYKNFHSGDQHITLVDPNTEKSVTIATIPREPPRFKKEDGRELRK
ncbi:hypothetical protein FB446DRAFT_795403 [Lentinula raphanica]|nr:hypothetical protein FB446DRAFT_795403 [Lentinula raphanica]